MSSAPQIRRALLSVSDKTGLTELGHALTAWGIELLATGGTATALRRARLAVRDVADITGFPEMMDGRVRTLHPAVHGGILAQRDSETHRTAMAEHGIDTIDLVVANLYPFETTVADGAEFTDCIERIDIGGPAMIRAAAKNHAFVAVVVDVEDYGALLAELDMHNGATSHGFRQRLALTAFARTGAYDAAVSNWLADALREAAPRRRVVAGKLVQTLRYGENPHQRGAFYSDGSDPAGVATATRIQGKELSYNNINDIDAAFGLVSEFADDRPACVIVKHANPCGVAKGDTLAEAYHRAFDCDRISAFGGIVALNRPLDVATASAITGIFTEAVIAPGTDADARDILSAKPGLRLLTVDALAASSTNTRLIRSVTGGFLIQDRDAGGIPETDLRIVSRRSPGQRELSDLRFAWKVVKHVKSNAIVYARDRATVGIGAGQTSRVDSVRIATRKALDMAGALKLDTPPTQGAVVASDAFFPFADGLLAAAEAGATAAIQPGGSLRDAEIIAAADELDLAMVFTRMRHFRH